MTQLHLEPKFYDRPPLPREPKSQDMAGSRLRSVGHLHPVLKPPNEPLASTSAHQPVLPLPGVPHGPAVGDGFEPCLLAPCRLTSQLSLFSKANVIALASTCIRQRAPPGGPLHMPGAWGRFSPQCTTKCYGFSCLALGTTSS